MTIKEAIQQGHDRAIVAYVDRLRDHGANYDQCYEAVNKIKPLQLPEFDEILRSGDDRY